MKFRYIAIEREYGSGGTRIAQLLSEKTGAAGYGRKILEMAAQQQNTTVEALEKYEENATNSILYSLYMMSRSQTEQGDMLCAEGKLFVAEQQVVRELAHRGPAVFVGHCAGHALRDREGVLRVFIKANEEDKKHRIVSEYGVDAAKAEAVRVRFDKKRSNYFAFCTRNKWSDMENYDLVLDSSCLGIENCVAVLAALMEGKSEKDS